MKIDKTKSNMSEIREMAVQPPRQLGTELQS